MSPQEFSNRLSKAEVFIKDKVPVIVGTEAVKHFKHGFQKGVEGFTDETLEHWPDISEKRKAQKRKANGAMTPILTDTGDLADSITWSHEADRVVISSDVPYAQRHNEGLNGMPKRQFMGPSHVLEQAIIDKIDRELRKIFS